MGFLAFKGLTYVRTMENAENHTDLPVINTTSTVLSFEFISFVFKKFSLNIDMKSGNTQKKRKQR